MPLVDLAMSLGTKLPTNKTMCNSRIKTLHNHKMETDLFCEGVFAHVPVILFLLIFLVCLKITWFCKYFAKLCEEDE